MRRMVGGYPGYPRIPEDTTPGYPRIPLLDTPRYHSWIPRDTMPWAPIADGWAARIAMRTMQNHVRVVRFVFLRGF